MARYKVYGTGEPYDGKVVSISGDLFTTIGGALEGDSKQVIKTEDNENPLSGNDLLVPGDSGNQRALSTISEDNPNTDPNPVTRLFNAPRTPRYYTPEGTIVPVGAPLHEHQDGTIMTQHSMGPNDNSVVVTTSRGTTGRMRRGGGNGNGNIGGMGGTGTIGGY